MLNKSRVPFLFPAYTYPVFPFRSSYRSHQTKGMSTGPTTKPSLFNPSIAFILLLTLPFIRCFDSDLFCAKKLKELQIQDPASATAHASYFCHPLSPCAYVRCSNATGIGSLLPDSLKSRVLVCRQGFFFSSALRVYYIIYI